MTVPAVVAADAGPAGADGDALVGRCAAMQEVYRPSAGSPGRTPRC
jgi:hypothetical protein